MRGRGRSKRIRQSPRNELTQEAELSQAEDEFRTESLPDLRIVALEAKVAELDVVSNGLRRDLEEVKARNAGLERHVVDQVRMLQQSMLKFVVMSGNPSVGDEDAGRTSTTEETSAKVLQFVKDSRSGVKKVLRATIRTFMFATDGEVHASDNREMIASKIFCYI
jgi:hypothetical protein